MIPPSSLVISQGWGLIDLPLRASNEGLLRPRVARAQKIIRLHPLLCSGSTGPTWVSFQSFLSCAFCEQEERSGYSLREAARCATTKGGPIAPFFSYHPPGNGGHRWRSRRASREHCFIVRPPRARKLARVPVDSLQAALLDFKIQF